MNITPEVRQLVLDQECERLGHQVNAHEAVVGNVDGMAVVGATDDLKLPHMTCGRCGQTWIVIPNSGKDYDDAERILYGALRAEMPAAKKLLRDRTKRINRDKPVKPPKPA